MYLHIFEHTVFLTLETVAYACQTIPIFLLPVNAKTKPRQANSRWTGQLIDLQCQASVKNAK